MTPDNRDPAPVDPTYVAGPPPATSSFASVSNRQLGRTTQRNVGYSLSAQALLSIIRLAGTVVLARHLAPEEFGLVAMATVVTGFLDMFRDAGLSMVTVQRKDLTHGDLNSLFWLNLGLGVLVALAIMAAGPFLAWLYDEPRMIPITLALAGITALGSAGIQHRALVRRQLNFRRIALIDVSAGIASAGAGIIAARLGASYWSLIVMFAANSTVSTALYTFTSGWKPGLPKIVKNTREFVKFGANLTGASLLSTLASRADNFLIAHYWGPAALGLYDRAYQLMMMPLRQFDNALGSAIIPSLCLIQEDLQRTRKAVFRAQSISFACTIPATASLMVFSEEVVRLVLGPKWMEVSPIFSVLAAVTVFMSICRPLGWVLRAQGRGSLILRMEACGAVLAILAFTIGVQWGPLGVARALLLENGLWSLVIIAVLKKQLELTLGETLRMTVRPLVLCAVLVAAGVLLRQQMGDHLLPAEMAATIGLFFFAAATVTIALQPNLIKEAKSFISSLRSKNNP